jgi:alpha-tubulin suppressor-like RCC1 family protein
MAQGAPGRRFWLGSVVALLVLSGCPGDEEPPAAVSDLVASTTATEAALEWTNPPEGYTGATIRRAVGSTAPGSVTDGTFVADMPWPDTTALARGLSPSTTYSFAVFAHDGDGNHAPSATVTVTTAAVDPGWGLVATPSATSVSLRWNNPPTPLAGTMVRRTTGSTPPASPTDGALVTDLAAPGATLTDTGLTAGTTYSYAAFAHDATPTYAAATTTTVTTTTSAPGAPAIGTALAGDGHAVVSWTAPASTGGSPITAYVVTPYIGTIAQTPVPFASDATTQTVTGLTNGTSYTFRVTASNAIGTGTASAASNVVTPRPAAVATGAGHTCAVVAGGSVRCWGDNVEGQLGDGTQDDALAPVSVDGLTGVTGLAASGQHTCAILTSAIVRCWGRNTEGQIGDGTVFWRRKTPRNVVGVTGATDVAAGTDYEYTLSEGARSHTCAVVAGGGVKCWGNDLDGQLGDGTAGGESGTPTSVVGVTGATAVAAGGSHSCAVVAAGAVKCWGESTQGQLGDGAVCEPTPESDKCHSATPVTVAGITGATDVAAGQAFTCALVTGGEVHCWGESLRYDVRWTVPQPIAGITGATAVVAGPLVACALLTDRTAKCWGHGALGDGAVTRSIEPVPVTGLTDVSAISVDQHACATRTGGGVQCWGSNLHGQLGNGQLEGVGRQPLPVDGLADAVAVAAGESHSCAVTAAGTVSCWGGKDGWLAGAPRGSPTPVTAPGVTGATAVVTGWGHTCALVTGGAVQCWGYNGYGQTGQASQATSSVPATVPGVSGATAIAAGAHHTCALVADGEVWCWGNNSAGQLGRGTLGNGASPWIPAPVQGLTGATQIASSSSGSHSCARLADATVRCWGYNGSGQLGDPAIGDRSPVPVPVSGLSGVTSLGTGAAHTCATDASGAVHCWGDNWAGQLGDGALLASATPVVVPGVTGATLVTSGGWFSCASVAEGAAACWGANTRAQLGHGTLGAQAPPGIVSGLEGASTIAAGADHTCAGMADGTVRCWGDNLADQLGRATPVWLTPVPVIGL